MFIGVRADVPVLRGPLDATATSEEARRSPASRVEPRPGGEGELPGLRDARLALLARKYEGRASVEDTARLQILNERLRRLAPRVTREDVEVVVEMVADAEGIASRLTAMKAKLGLR